MSVALTDQEMEGIRQRTTEDLLAIWRANDRTMRSGSEFDAISDVLFERGIVAPAQEGHFTTASSLSGVRGWLLFFCISLVIFRPLVYLFALSSGQDLSWAAMALPIAICAFGVYAGVELWRIAPAAVKKAKAFLWTYLALTVAAGVLVVSESEEVKGEDLSDMLRSIIFFCFWYLYLLRSQRVRNTYTG